MIPNMKGKKTTLTKQNAMIYGYSCFLGKKSEGGEAEKGEGGGRK